MRLGALRVMRAIQLPLLPEPESVLDRRDRGTSFHRLASRSVLNPPASTRNGNMVSPAIRRGATRYFIGLVEYGDHNHLMMQAHSVGAPCIAYRGNEYADYWLTPGDQRVMAAELLAILKGQVEPRVALPAPDIAETALAMQTIYEPLLLKKYVPGFTLASPAPDIAPEPEEEAAPPQLRIEA